MVVSAESRYTRRKPLQRALCYLYWPTLSLKLWSIVVKKISCNFRRNVSEGFSPAAKNPRKFRTPMRSGGSTPTPPRRGSNKKWTTQIRNAKKINASPVTTQDVTTNPATRKLFLSLPRVFSHTASLLYAHPRTHAPTIANTLSNEEDSLRITFKHTRTHYHYH